MVTELNILKQGAILMSTPKTKPIPQGMHSLTPHLVCAGAASCPAPMKKFMADPRLEAIDMPFDGKRMMFGGFETMLES